MKSEELFREIDEDLRRDEMAKLWRRYGGLVMAAVALAVLASAAWVGWQEWQRRVMAAEAQRFAAADEAPGRAPAQRAQAFATLADDATTGYAALARLRAAESWIAAGDPAQAEAALEALADNEAAEPLLRDLAQLMVAANQLDTADPAALIGRIEPLAAPGAPWRHTARELLAMAAVRAGDTERARALLGELTREAGVPPAQQARARELLESLGGPLPQASS